MFLISGTTLRRRLLEAVVVILVGLFLRVPPSPAMVGDTGGAFGLDGSLRTIGALFRNYDFPAYFEDERADEYFQSLFRLAAAGRPHDGLSYEVHLVQALTYFSGPRKTPGNGGITIAGGKTRYRAMDEASEWWSGEHTRALLWMDRCNVKVALAGMDITLGRQAVTFGKAHFWNPLDVYLPFDPNQFDRDYKAGVDALRVDIPLTSFSGITMVGVLGRELDASGNYLEDNGTLDANWYGSSLLGRYFTNVAGWDLAFQAGKVYGGYQFGGGVVGEIEGVELRGEAALFRASESPPLPMPFAGDVFEDTLTVVFGLGRRFENSLILEAEYLYNGGGESHAFNTAASRLAWGAVRHLGKHLAGILASYEFTRLLTGQFTSIYSLSDDSLELQPTLTLSVSDNSELLAGLSLNFGRRPAWDPSGIGDIRSEFGSYPHSIFVEFKVYF
ncbi:MAG: hypothetical protein JXL84_14550 [Deltaproteobacteria bacterium]|nr:hypothetical protein [Deltaproteobacteria bacterium]